MSCKIGRAVIIVQTGAGIANDFFVKNCGMERGSEPEA